MKKWIFSLALITSLPLYAGPFHSTSSYLHKVQKFSPIEAGYLHPDTVPTEHLKVVGMEINGFSSASLDKLQLAFEVLEESVNSEEFKDRVINFKNSNGERAFASNKGLSNEEIYKIFMDGREVLQPNTPGEMNFFLKQYYKYWSRVIGYTYPDINLIYINWKFFKNFRPHQIASNLTHEWIHKLGFGHTSSKEHDSVPYGIGYIIKDIAYRKLKEKRLH